jgi:hypothetical protein
LSHGQPLLGCLGALLASSAWHSLFSSSSGFLTIDRFVAVKSIQLYILPMPTDEFEAALMQWRQERNKRLRSDDKSWFNLAGLYWLKDGDNTFGSDPSCSFVLPPGAPKKAGLFYVKNGSVTVNAAPGVKIQCNGEKLPSLP